MHIENVIPNVLLKIPFSIATLNLKLSPYTICKNNYSQKQSTLSLRLSGGYHSPHITHSRPNTHLTTNFLLFQVSLISDTPTLKPLCT